MNDSRQYRFAYLIRTRKDFPEDFPNLTERTLFPALFLPRDGNDCFARAVSPPRVVLFTGEMLEVHFHPESGRHSASFRCDEYLSIQTGRLLLIGWVRLASKEADLTLPYNRRVDEPVDLFLGMLRARLLSSDGDPPRQVALLGDAMNLKFQNTLNHEIDKGEVESLRLFIAPRRHSSGRWPFRIDRMTPGNLIAFTDRRLLWISESHRLVCVPYGSVTCYAHLDDVADVETDLADAVSRLSVLLRNGKVWNLDIPEDLRADAHQFASIAKVRGGISRGRQEVRI